MIPNKVARHARIFVRTAFALFVVALGVQFWMYVRGLLGGGPAVAKPFGVEGFLPVAALVGLKHWLSTGQFDPVHPAGLAILLAATLLSFLLAKGFCGWLCPFGSACDGLRRIGQTVLGRPLRAPRWLDLSLRSLKYLLLAAFLYGTQVALDAQGAAAFLTSPYNVVADIQMLRFLLAPGAVFLSIVGLTAVASLAGISLWCRYLCPYGALLGLVGFLGPGHVRRYEEPCIACGQCRRACPSDLPVSERQTLKSPECNFCGRCVEACPVEGALRMRVFKVQLAPWVVGLLCVALLWGATLVARTSGHWESRVPREVISQSLRAMGGLF